MKKKGFTLIELLVTIIIIIIMASIILPSVDRCKESARRIVCTNNLKQISQAFYLYAQDYNAYFPYRGTFAREQLSSSGNFIESLGILKDAYIDNMDIFFCPSEKDWKKGSEYPHTVTVHGHTNGNHYGNYLNMSWDDTTRRRITDPPNKAIIADLHVTYGKTWLSTNTRTGRVHKGEGYNVCYIDGHIKWKEFDKVTSSFVLNSVPEFAKIDE